MLLMLQWLSQLLLRLLGRGALQDWGRAAALQQWAVRQTAHKWLLPHALKV
jgi:hypothetical protein